MAKVILEVKLNIKPMSANQMHYAKFKKDTVKYKQFKEDIRHLLGDDYVIDPKWKLKLTLIVGYSSKLSDLDNSFKPLLDSMQLAMGFDDRQIFSIEALKEHTKKGEEFLLIRLEKITDKQLESKGKRMFPKESL